MTKTIVVQDYKDIRIGDIIYLTDKGYTFYYERTRNGTTDKLWFTDISDGIIVYQADSISVYARPEKALAERGSGPSLRPALGEGWLIMEQDIVSGRLVAKRLIPPQLHRSHLLDL